MFTHLHTFATDFQLNQWCIKATNRILKTLRDRTTVKIKIVPQLHK